MFGDHIAHAMARERQQDLVPELRTLERERSDFGTEDGEHNDARAVNSLRKPGRWARSRFGRASARPTTGRSQAGQQAS
jgi:hypothetical protein